MRPVAALGLAAAGIAAVAAGWYLGIARTPAPVAVIAEGRLVFPDLAAHLSDAAQVEILHQDKVLTFVRKGEVWGIAERGGYPVQPARLRALLVGLAELRLSEPRTAEPAQFARLGVEDPKAATSGASLVRVLDAQGKPLAELIVGHTRARPDSADSVYVRRQGEDQAWLADGQVPVEGDANAWLQRAVLDIAPDHIASVSVTRGTDRLDFARDGDRLVLKSPADHPPLDDTKIAGVGQALEQLNLTDVRQAADQPGEKPAEKLGEASYVTTDGLNVHVTAERRSDTTWMRLEVSGEAAAKDEAARLSALVDGWAYRFGAWKERFLVPTLDEMKAPPGQASPAGDASPPPPGLPHGLPPGMSLAPPSATPPTPAR